MSRGSQSHKPGFGAGGLAGLPRGEAMKLGSLFMLALLFTFFVLWGLRDQTRKPVLPLPPIPSRVDKGIDIKVEVIPWRPPRRRLNSIIRQSTRADRVRSYPEAINILAPLVADRPYTHFLLDEEYEDVGGFALVPIEDLLDPARSLEFRAEPIEVKGVLREWRSVLPSAFELDEKVFKRPLWLAELEVEGHPVQALLLGKPPDSIVTPGRIYKVRGVFYRLRDILKRVDENGREVEEYVTVPLLLAKSVAPVVPLHLVEKLPPDLKDRIKDATDYEDLPPPPQADENFFVLAGYALAHKNRIPGPDDEVIFVKGRGVIENPEEYRLKFVETRGEIVYMNWEGFEYPDMRPEDAPTLGYWHCIISHSQPSINAPISLLIPWAELPEGIGIGAVVRARGIYFRVHAYENRKGQLSLTPLVVATMDPWPDPLKPTTIADPFVVGAIIAFGLVTLLLVGMLVRDRRRAARLEEKLREERVRRRHASGMNLDALLPSGEEGRRE